MGTSSSGSRTASGYVTGAGKDSSVLLRFAPQSTFPVGKASGRTLQRKYEQTRRPKRVTGRLILSHVGKVRAPRGGVSEKLLLSMTGRYKHFCLFRETTVRKIQSRIFKTSDIWYLSSGNRRISAGPRSDLPYREGGTRTVTACGS